jgi:hypothetical protein
MFAVEQPVRLNPCPDYTCQKQKKGAAPMGTPSLLKAVYYWKVPVWVSVFVAVVNTVPPALPTAGVTSIE